MTSFNDNIIAEFRANGGKVGGRFADMPLLLLTATGRRSGRPTTSPVAYSTTASGYVIAGSNGGQDRHPEWLLNLAANPVATIEIDNRSMTVKARVLTSGEERDRLFAAHSALMPAFSNYMAQTSRTIPVAILEPVEPDTAT
jgi:deazaflavin-dependent oxidoreductase (nitroreductase family)